MLVAEGLFTVVCALGGWGKGVRDLHVWVGVVHNTPVVMANVD